MFRRVAVHIISTWSPVVGDATLPEAIEMDKRLETLTDETTEPMPAIFGLRFLEDEAAEIHDIVGCMIATGTRTGTGCDDTDQIVLA
jgi:hypothetical protein